MSKGLKYKIQALSLMVISLFVLFSADNAEAANLCFCSVSVEKITPLNLDKYQEVVDSACLPLVTSADCLNVSLVNSKYKTTKPLYEKCELAINETACLDLKKQWDASLDYRIKSVSSAVSGVTEGLQGKIMPKCVTENILSPECRDIGVFVVLGINVVSYLFTFIGALALLMFVYGGFTLILSQGNPEKVKKGTGILTASVIGLVVAFGGYLLIQFLGSDVLKVKKVGQLITDWLV